MAEHDQQFETFATWVGRASSWLTKPRRYGERPVCFDAKGRICQQGSDFMRARDENAFPVRWIWPSSGQSIFDFAPLPQHIQAALNSGDGSYRP